MGVYRLSIGARSQISGILLKSAKEFGTEAAGRYSRLIFTSLEWLGDDPFRLGSFEVPQVPGIRAYAIRHSRGQVLGRERVKSPRHLVIYRVEADGGAFVFGFVHDRMVLSRAARKLVRKAADP